MKFVETPCDCVGANHGTPNMDVTPRAFGEDLQNTVVSTLFGTHMKICGAAPPPFLIGLGWFVQYLMQ